MPADIFGHVPSPPGTIAYWDDDPINLPAGWVVCDGNNGTPNLLDEFLKSVPDGATNPGSVGGQHTKTLSESQIASHDHGAGSTTSAGSHSHTVDRRDEERGFYLRLWPVSGTAHSTSTNGNHSHNVTFSSTGSGSTIDNRPNSIRLVPIMKT